MIERQANALEIELLDLGLDGEQLLIARHGHGAYIRL
jgi:hypothetical protein